MQAPCVEIGIGEKPAAVTASGGVQARQGLPARVAELDQRSPRIVRVDGRDDRFAGGPTQSYVPSQARDVLTRFDSTPSTTNYATATSGPPGTKVIAIVAMTLLDRAAAVVRATALDVPNVVGGRQWQGVSSSMALRMADGRSLLSEDGARGGGRGWAVHFSGP